MNSECINCLHNKVCKYMDEFEKMVSAINPNELVKISCNKKMGNFIRPELHWYSKQISTTPYVVDVKERFE